MNRERYPKSKVNKLLMSDLVEINKVLIMNLVFEEIEEIKMIAIKLLDANNKVDLVEVFYLLVEIYERDERLECPFCEEKECFLTCNWINF